MSSSAKSNSDDATFARFELVADGVVGLVPNAREPWQLEDLARTVVPPFVVTAASDALLSRMVAHLVASKDGRSLLHVMGVLAMPLLALKARFALDNAIEQGLSGPSAVARRCGTLAPDTAWIAEQGGALAAVLIRMARPGLARVQAAGLVTAEEIDGGIASAIWTRPMSAAALYGDIVAPIGADPDMTLREVPVREAIDALVGACRANLDVGLGPSDEALDILNVVLAAAKADSHEGLVTALGFLPAFSLPGTQDQEEFEFRDAPNLSDAELKAIEGAVDDVCTIFNQRIAAKERDPDRRELVEFVGRSVVEYQAWQRDGEPWTGAMARDYLLAHLPRRVRFEPGDIPLVPGIVGRVLEFLSGHGDGLELAHAGAIATALERMAPQFAAEMANPANRGPAARIGDAMLADGVDISDQDAVQAWLRAFNALPKSEREKVLPDEAFASLPTPPAPPSGQDRPPSRRKPPRRMARKAKRR